MNTTIQKVERPFIFYGVLAVSMTGYGLFRLCKRYYPEIRSWRSRDHSTIVCTSKP